MRGVTANASHFHVEKQKLKISITLNHAIFKAILLIITQGITINKENIFKNRTYLQITLMKNYIRNVMHSEL